MSLAVPEVSTTTTSSATSNDRVGIIATMGFQLSNHNVISVLFPGHGLLEAPITTRNTAEFAMPEAAPDLCARSSWWHSGQEYWWSRVGVWHWSSVRVAAHCRMESVYTKWTLLPLVPLRTPPITYPKMTMISALMTSRKLSSMSGLLMLRKLRNLKTKSAVCWRPI